MTFDDWMLTVNPLHHPTDDGMETRLLRRCWDESRALEREQCAHVCSGIAAGYAGVARYLDGQRSTHAAGQRDGANECAAAIRRA